MLDNPWHCKKETFDESSLGVIVDGITDFNAFSSQLQKYFNNQVSIVQFSKTSSFILLSNTYFEEFERLKNYFIDFHYQVYSIFLKDSFFDKFIELFDQENSEIPIFKEELFYLFFEAKNYNSYQYQMIKNYFDFKIISKSPPRYICGFNTFSDLLKSYFYLIKEGDNWPLFALSFTFIEKVNLYNFDQRNEIKENSLLITQNIHGKFPSFKYDKKLFYLSFIERERKRPQRIQNSNEMYSIKDISDIQISHTYKEQIRTFLGFNSLFRCLHVYDYFLYLEKESNSINDIILIENSNSVKFEKISFDLFYIQIQYSYQSQHLLFNSSLLFSINYVDLVDLNSSYFFGFNNQDDFDFALEILTNSQKKLINDVKLVEREEFNQKFDSKIATKMLKTKFFYLVFSSLSNELSDLQKILKKAKVVEKNVNYKFDNKSESNWILVGFINADDREKAHLSLKNMQKSNEINIFYPEKQEKQKKSIIKIRRKRTISKLNQNEYEYDNDDNQIELNDEKDFVNENLNPKSNEIQQKTNQKNLSPEYFAPNQNLIYIYFIEKEKARKMLQGKVKLTLFGVKKCQDVQRYKKINEEESGYFTFFGFEHYEDAIVAVNDIKSKWLSESPINVYEHTNAFINHQKNPQSIYNDDEELFIQAINDKKQKQSKAKTEEKIIMNINDLRINTYNKLPLRNNLPFIFFYNQRGTPANLQLEIKKALNKSKCAIDIKKDLIIDDFFYEPYTFILADSFNPIIHSFLMNALAQYKIKFSTLENESHSHFHFLEFEEKIIPQDILDKFLFFLSKIDEIQNIERNVFHNGSIVTIIYFDFQKGQYIMQFIKEFLSNENCLFDTGKYSIKQTIYFNEEITLKRKEDFDLIINEIENFGIHPISIKRNKILFLNIPYDNRCLQNLSFIYFQSIQDKLKALNHINSIVLKDKDNVMIFNPSLYYLKIDPNKYGEKFNPDNWNTLSKLVKNLVDVQDFKKKALSIESTVELAYIGFKSKEYYAFYSFSILSRLVHLCYFPNSNFFNPKKNMHYIQYETKNSADLLKIIGRDLFSFIKDYQINCFEQSSTNKKVLNYIGFEKEQERQFFFFQLTSVINNPNIYNIAMLGIDMNDTNMDETGELITENLLTLFD